MIKTTTIKKRKRRSDRNHIVYVLTNVVTKEKYVGIAVCVDRAGKETLAARWCRHVGRAKLQGKNWALCESIRTYGEQSFKKEIKCIIRGKAEAHAYETQLRKTGRYALNTV